MNQKTQNRSIIDEWVVPEPFKEPDWVETSLNEFKEKTKEVLRRESDQKKVNKEVQKFIYEIIMNKKVLPFYPLNKKNITKTVQKMWDVFGEDEFIYRYYLFGHVGFFLGTLKPAGFSVESLELPEEFKRKKEKLLINYQKMIEKGEKGEKGGKDSKGKAISWIDKEFDKLTKEVIDYWDSNGIDTADIVLSGSRGSSDDIRKLIVAVGLSINSKGEINDIILNPHIEGLSQTQMFNYSSQAIQALYAKSSETAVPGYLARKLSTMMEPVVLSEVVDCKATKFLTVEVQSDEVFEALIGRVQFNGKVIKEGDYEKYKGKKIKLRSPLYCKAKDGICKTCYNPEYVEKLKMKPKEKIGLIASTFMGSDALVNLTLKKSHVGISLDAEQVNLEEDIFKYAE